MNTGFTPVYLRQAINNLDTLPSMPVITQKILSLNLNDDAGEIAMLKLIEQDPQIAAKLIGMANSPLFGTSKRISSVADAAVVLGITRVKSITIGIAVMSSLNKGVSGKLDTQKLWLHSIAIALALKTISSFMPPKSRPLDDEIFLAGLLHDIGYLVLNHLDKGLSDELNSRFETESHRPGIEIEAELLDITHCELGAELARHWCLPESVVAVLHYHHDPENVHASAGQPLVRMVVLAEKILPAFGMSYETCGEISPDECLALGIDSTEISDLVEKLKAHIEEASGVAAVLA